MNQKQAVGATAPGKDAVVVLQGQGPSGDPRAAASAFAEKNRLGLSDGRADRIGGYDAYRARATANSQQGPVVLDLTWVAPGDDLYLGTAVAYELRWIMDPSPDRHCTDDSSFGDDWYSHGTVLPTPAGIRHTQRRHYVCSS